MLPGLKKLNFQAMLFLIGLVGGYVLGSLWPGFFLILFLPFGFRGRFTGERGKGIDFSYLIAAILGLSAGFLLAFVERITSL
jgi:hypothetical protein